jgi:hypothetical protein
LCELELQGAPTPAMDHSGACTGQRLAVHASHALPTHRADGIAIGVDKRKGVGIWVPGEEGGRLSKGRVSGGRPKARGVKWAG